jgi:hypothetical protein
MVVPTHRQPIFPDGLRGQAEDQFAEELATMVDGNLGYLAQLGQPGGVGGLLARIHTCRPPTLR